MESLKKRPRLMSSNDIDNNDEIVPSLFNIPITDALYSNILPRLEPKDLFSLRIVCKEMNNLVTEYFKINEICDFSSVPRTEGLQTFKIFTKDSTNLRVINLNNCKWVDSGTLNPLLERNKGLRHLSVCDCVSLSTSSLQVLADNAADLQSLNLSNCDWVTSDAVISLVKCQKLESINLTSCYEVTDEAVCELVTNCTGLKTLCVTQLYKITDKSLAIIAHKLNYLEHLNLMGCKKITEDGIKLVKEHCQHLKTLKFKIYGPLILRALRHPQDWINQ